MDEKKVKSGCEYFECQKCGTIIEVNQDEKREKYVISQYTIFHPTECYEDQGGCGRKSNFLRLKKEYVQTKFNKMARL